jgi:DNA-directed RNA polymerase specialized sigma24 family protein
MDSDAPGSVTRFFDALCAGDPAGAEALWERFFPRLVGLARRALAGRPQRAADADDAALSAFASFCLRARAGEFRPADREGLWHLLAVITTRKARKQARREGAEKRGGGSVGDEETLALPLAEVAVSRAEPDRGAAPLGVSGARDRRAPRLHRAQGGAQTEPHSTAMGNRVARSHRVE